MLDVINSLLDLAKRDAGKMKLEAEPLELRGILENGGGIMREQCLRGELTLERAPIDDELIVWLPLTKALVDLHGGAMRIDSAPGRGTTVTVTLLEYSREVEMRALAGAVD